MEAQIITDRQVWDEFIASSASCNISQTYEWGELMAPLGSPPLRIGVLDEAGKLCAVMLILVTHLPKVGFSYFYAPRGPIIDDPNSMAMDVLLAFVRREARKQHAFMLKVEPGALDGDEQWLGALRAHGFRANSDARHMRHEWVLDIRPDEKVLLAGMRKTWRYGVRLAERKEVSIREGEGDADIAAFYHILQTTQERNGGFHVFDLDYYKRVMRLYGEHAKLLLAVHEGEVIAGALVVALGHWCWYMYGASSNAHRDVMPNHLLQWKAFGWAKQQGCWYYSFRGIPDILEPSEPMWGLYLFKSGFGGYPLMSLETHDLVYNPLLYTLYRQLLIARQQWRKRKDKAHVEAEKSEAGSDQAKVEAEKSRSTANKDKNATEKDTSEVGSKRAENRKSDVTASKADAPKNRESEARSMSNGKRGERKLKSEVGAEKQAVDVNKAEEDKGGVGTDGSRAETLVNESDAGEARLTPNM